MIQISKYIEIDAGHRVPSHRSKCRNLHGHRYRVELIVEAPDVVHVEGDQQEGMVIDFGFMKEALMEAVHDAYDHTLILSHADPLLRDSGFIAAMDAADQVVRVVPCSPTAEELAKFWYGLVAQEVFALLVAKGTPSAHLDVLRVKALRVHETPTSVAVYVP